ncbi:MAG: hypothetical protein OEU50_13105 [Gammaproteobacteria bacterium]|nr:hypothetical protein [Gammaproteobacteria bacterium]
MNRGLKLSFAFLLLISSAPAFALELFGVALESASRDELRAATAQAGLLLVREGGEDNWYDVYDSSSALAGSTRFYLGFVKKNQRFAFAEYEFRGFSHKQLLRQLTLKYGKAEVEGGRFVSDHRYRWQRDGIQIELNSDWQRYRTRLTYLIPQNMSDLLAERAAYNSRQQAQAAQVSLY